jgi:hypothetical protein
MNQIGFTQEGLDRIKKYLVTKVPPILPKSSHYKFVGRYVDGSWTVKDDKVLHNGKECVAKEDVVPTLERLWSDPFYSHATARRFWTRVMQEFEGFSLSKVSAFLATKRTSQVFRRPHRMEVTPINTKSPREQLNIDYIDLKSQVMLMGTIATVSIDHFSKYLWVWPLKSRDSDLAAEKIRGLFEQGHVPRVLHADGEFANNELMKVCADYNCLFIKSEAYRPNANGCCERVNRTLKTAIRELQVEYDDLTFIDSLDKLVSNYNLTRHSAHKKTPREVYYGSKDVVAEALETQYT